jgi:hypothetical protein
VPIPRHRLIWRGRRLLAAGLLICAALASPAGAKRRRRREWRAPAGDDAEHLLRRRRARPANGDWCAKRSGCSAAFAKVLQTIRASGADVVGLEEGEHSTRRIARALGWFASERLQVVSRYRLIDPPEGGGVFIYVGLGPGSVVAIANAHLPSTPYGPYRVRDGATPAQLDELERSTRLPAVQEHLDVLPPLASNGIPSS